MHDQLWASACMWYAEVGELMQLHVSRSLFSDAVQCPPYHTADWRPDSRPFVRRRFRPIIRCYQWQSNSLEWFIVTGCAARRDRTIVQTTAADASPSPSPPVARLVAIKRRSSPSVTHARLSLSGLGCVMSMLHNARITVSLNYCRSYVTLCAA